jgi:hypothetical protein
MLPPLESYVDSGQPCCSINEVDPVVPLLMTVIAAPSIVVAASCSLLLLSRLSTLKIFGLHPVLSLPTKYTKK